MDWIFDDGGRAAAGYKGRTGDCVCRAIAIATETPYAEVYALINQYGKAERPNKITRRGNKWNDRRSSARTGVYKDTMKKIMTEHFGWKWVPTMKIGQGCKVHLRENELPKGRIIVKCTKHAIAVIDGVIHDTYDSTRGQSDRCVYGYYVKA